MSGGLCLSAQVLLCVVYAGDLCLSARVLLFVGILLFMCAGLFVRARSTPLLTFLAAHASLVCPRAFYLMLASFATRASLVCPHAFYPMLGFNFRTCGFGLHAHSTLYLI